LGSLLTLKKQFLEQVLEKVYGRDLDLGNLKVEWIFMLYFHSDSYKSKFDQGPEIAFSFRIRLKGLFFFTKGAFPPVNHQNR